MACIAAVGDFDAGDPPEFPDLAIGQLSQQGDATIGQRFFATDHACGKEPSPHRTRALRWHHDAAQSGKTRQALGDGRQQLLEALPLGGGYPSARHLAVAIALNARAGVLNIPPSLVEMSRSFGATRYQSFVNIYVWAALPEILAGIRLGMIRAVKGVIIGQLLISVVGFGTLFEVYASHFLMEHFWALILVIFSFAFTINEVLAWTERKISYYASSR